MKYLPLLLGGGLAVFIIKKLSEKKTITPFMQVSEKMEIVRNQMATAFAKGDTLKYIQLQKELEFLDLENI